MWAAGWWEGAVRLCGLVGTGGVRATSANTIHDVRNSV